MGEARRGARDSIGVMPQSNLPVGASGSTDEGRSQADGGVLDLLARAAQLADQAGVSSEAFLSAAWAAYLDARPAFREGLEHKQLLDQLAALRARGQLAQA
jgi:hypothetical protein